MLAQTFGQAGAQAMRPTDISGYSGQSSLCGNQDKIRDHFLRLDMPDLRPRRVVERSANDGILEYAQNIFRGDSIVCVCASVDGSVWRGTCRTAAGVFHCWRSTTEGGPSLSNFTGENAG